MNHAKEELDKERKLLQKKRPQIEKELTAKSNKETRLTMGKRMTTFIHTHTHAQKIAYSWSCVICLFVFKMNNQQLNRRLVADRRHPRRPRRQRTPAAPTTASSSPTTAAALNSSSSRSSNSSSK